MVDQGSHSDGCKVGEPFNGTWRYDVKCPRCDYSADGNDRHVLWNLMRVHGQEVHPGMVHPDLGEDGQLHPPVNDEAV